jgi:hypothetical protein
MEEQKGIIDVSFTVDTAEELTLPPGNLYSMKTEKCWWFVAHFFSQNGDDNDKSKNHRYRYIGPKSSTEHAQLAIMKEFEHHVRMGLISSFSITVVS